MKPKIIYNTRILKAWPFKRIGAIVLWPFIILRKEYKGTGHGARVLVHEKIHWAQVTELYVIPFYILYVLNFFYNLVTLNPKPYKNIIFERESFKNQDNPHYLTTRKKFAFLKF